MTLLFLQSNAGSDSLTITFQHLGAWYEVLLLITLAGILITGAVMRGMANLVREKDESGQTREAGMDHPSTGKPLLGAPAALLFLPLTGYKRFAVFHSRLAEKSIALLKKWLQFDYVFMCCLYPFMIVLALWLTGYTPDCNTGCSQLKLFAVHPSSITGTHHFFTNALQQLPVFINNILGWNKLACLAMVTWLADILENHYALRALQRAGADKSLQAYAPLLKKEVTRMRCWSWVKWITGIVYAAITLTLLSCHLCCVLGIRAEGVFWSFFALLLIIVPGGFIQALRRAWKQYPEAGDADPTH